MPENLSISLFLIEHTQGIQTDARVVGGGPSDQSRHSENYQKECYDNTGLSFFLRCPTRIS